MPRCVLIIVVIASVGAGHADKDDPPTIMGERHWVHELGSAPQRTAKIYSQGVQDGIIDAIFSRVNITNSFFVEFGLGYEGSSLRDYSSISVREMDTIGLNTRLLAKRGWKGVYFDAQTASPAFNVTRAVLTRANICQHFQKAEVPQELDYLSIDVDSIDLWLLLGLLEGGFRPRVLSVEFNANFPADLLISVEPQWKAWAGRAVAGASAAALNFVASKFGYKVVHLMRERGPSQPPMDMFFIRGDVLESAGGTATLPTFVELAKGVPLPYRIHAPCVKQDLKRLVHVPLFLDGSEAESRRHAVQEVRHLSETVQSKWKVKASGPRELRWRMVGMCHLRAFENTSSSTLPIDGSGD